MSRRNLSTKPSRVSSVYSSSGAITHSAKLRPKALFLVIAILLVAVAVRVWHDRRTPPVVTLNEVEQRVRAHPDDVQAQLDWGNALHKMGRLSEAGQAFQTARRLAPDNARPYNWLGILAMEQQQPEAARNYFRESLTHNASDPDIWRALAQLSEQRQDDRAAIDAYEHLTQLRPNDAAAWRQLGILYNRKNLWARGQAALQHAATLDPKDTRTQTELGNNALTQGDLPQAKQAFDQALALHPDDSDALVGAARVTLQLDPTPAGWTRAEQQVHRALTLHPTGQALMVRGQIRMQRRDYADAIADLKAALAQDKSLLSAYIYLSQAYARSGQAAFARKASADYQAALAASRQPQKPSHPSPGEMAR